MNTKKRHLISRRFINKERGEKALGRSLPKSAHSTRLPAGFSTKTADLGSYHPAYKTAHGFGIIPRWTGCHELMIVTYLINTGIKHALHPFSKWLHRAAWPFMQ